MRGAVAALTMAACLAPAAAAAQEAAVADPWEGVNRDLYAVHNSIDQVLLEPVARGYRAITTQGIREGVSNVLDNLGRPVTFVNDVLQGEPGRAGVTAARFGVNTTIGILGIFDPARSMGLEPHDEDFGQTLAVWGVDAGPYLFVPVLGPTNVRDGFGRIVDIAFDPLTWAEFDEVDTVRITRTLVGGVDAREGVLEAVDGVRATSIDPYVTFRTTYGTLRQGQILNGDTSFEALPSFDDNLDMPDDPAPTTEEKEQHSEVIQNSDGAATLEGAATAPTSAQQSGETS